MPVGNHRMILDLKLKIPNPNLRIWNFHSGILKIISRVILYVYQHLRSEF